MHHDNLADCNFVLSAPVDGGPVSSRWANRCNDTWRTSASLRCLQSVVELLSNGARPLYDAEGTSYKDRRGAIVYFEHAMQTEAGTRHGTTK